MEIAMNIRKKGGKGIEKTYRAEGYDLMLGTLEDFMAIVDLDKMDDPVEVVKMVTKGYGALKPLLMDIFPELTEDELRRVAVADLVEVVKQIALSVIDSLGLIKSGNAARA